MADVITMTDARQAALKRVLASLETQISIQYPDAALVMVDRQDLIDAIVWLKRMERTTSAARTLNEGPRVHPEPRAGAVEPASKHPAPARIELCRVVTAGPHRNYGVPPGQPVPGHAADPLATHSVGADREQRSRRAAPAADREPRQFREVDPIEAAMRRNDKQIMGTLLAIGAVFMTVAMWAVLS